METSPRKLLLAAALLAASALSAVPAAHAGAAPLIAVGDADMAPSAYTDGILDPRVPGAQDLVLDVDPQGGPQRSTPVSNAVTGPALAVDKSPDGRLAVVVETTGNAPAGATRLEQLPPGRQVTLLGVRAGARPVVLDRFEAPSEPTSAEFSPDGRRVLVASRDPQRPVTVVDVRRGRFGTPRHFGLGVAPGAAAHATWRPDGEQIAVVLQEQRREVLFYAYSKRGLRLAGGPVQVAPRAFSGFYTPDGRTFVVNSVRIGGGTPLPPPGTPVDPADFAGSLAVIDLRGRIPRLAQTVATPIFPEGFALSPDGRRAVTVNLQTSSLPPAHPLFSPISSVSLWAIEGGRLTKLGADTTFEGVLPEGVDFDPSGRRLAVATYQRDWAALAGEGSIDIWRLDEARATPTLERRIPVMRGVHSVAWAK